MEKSRDLAKSLEGRMRQAEEERLQVEEARLRAMEAQKMAEMAANLEKEEREKKVLVLRLFRLMKFSFFFCHQLSVDWETRKI